MIAKLASEPHINRRTIYVIEVKFKKINGVRFSDRMAILPESYLTNDCTYCLGFIPFCGIFSISCLILIHMNQETNRIVEIQL